MIPTPSANNSKDDKENNSAANNAAGAGAADKAKRFEGEGAVFKAKLIGSELVMEPRGDKMCQNSITRLKAIIKGTNSHKKRIVLKISLAGIKVFDEKTNEILHDNEVSQISYIASDDSDTRCFGYVCDVPNKAHQFVCFKTSCPAAQVMSTMSELFDAVLKSKKQRESVGEEGSKAEEDKNKNKEPITDLIIGDLSSDEPAEIDIKGSSVDTATATATGTGTVQAAITGNKGFSFDDGFSDMNSQSTPSLTTTNTDVLQQQRQMSQQSSSMDQSASFMSMAGRVTQMSRANSNSLDLIDDSGIMDNNNDDSVFGGGTGLISNTNKQTTSTTTTSSTAPPVTIPIDQQQQQQQQQQLAGSHPSSSNQFQQQARRQNNRSLIYNHSSKSLSDAMLPPRQTGSSTNSNILNQLSASSSMRQDSYADRYAVFNDIDNLPSIFESTSLNSINNASNDNIKNNTNSSAGAAKVSPFNTDHSFGNNSFGNFQSSTNSQAGNFANAHHINSISNNSIGRSGYGINAAAGFKSSGTNIHAATFDFGSNSNLHSQNMFAGGDMHQQSHHLHHQQQQHHQPFNYGSSANLSHQQDQHSFGRGAMPTAVPQVPRRQQVGFAGNRLSSSFASSGFAGSGAPGTGSDAAAAHKWFSSSSASMGDVIGHACSSSSTGGPTNIAHLSGQVSSTGGPTAAGGVPSNSAAAAAAATHQWLASSTASMRSVNLAANDAGSNSNIFRQTNPFDDEFFS